MNSYTPAQPARILCNVLCLALLVTPLFAKEPTSTKQSPQATVQPARFETLVNTPTTPIPTDPLGNLMARARLGEQELANRVADYTCMFVRRERIDGELGERQYITAKIRHHQPAVDGKDEVPFSVYLYFHYPANVKGREVLYVDGQNGGKMLARRGGERLGYLTSWVAPTSELAMRDNRHPVTELGILNLVRRFADFGNTESKVGLQIQNFENAKINSRSCRHLRVINSKQTGAANFYTADIYLDEKLGFPVRYVAHELGSDGRTPELVEEYTYAKLNFNVGLTDADFSPENPSYGFKKRRLAKK